MCCAVGSVLEPTKQTYHIDAIVTTTGSQNGHAQGFLQTSNIHFTVHSFVFTNIHLYRTLSSYLHGSYSEHEQ